MPPIARLSHRWGLDLTAFERDRPGKLGIHSDNSIRTSVGLGYAFLKWSTSNAVFVTEIDDEHKEIFEALGEVQKVLTSHGQLLDFRNLMEHLTSCVANHFAHEERLMRAARYGSMRWHKQSHDSARRRVGRFSLRIERGDTKAGIELLEYLTAWLHDHTRVADRMMGAFLRNQQRSMVKLTFRAGAKPIDACTWVRANGDTLLNPGSRGNGS